MNEISLCRQRGSRKHISLLIASGAIVGAVQTAAALALGRCRTILSIPHDVIFCSFAPFLADIPALSQFEVLEQRFSDKSFVILAGLQFLYLSKPGSLFPALICIAAGALVRIDAFGLARVRVPERLSRVFDETLGSLLRSRPPHLQLLQRHQRAAAQHQRQNLPGDVPGMAEPPREAIEQLQAMGFSPHQVQAALQSSGNDVQLALALLLSESQQ